MLANPPFNISDWWHGSLDNDPRWVCGTPPAGNANYAWLQHMLYHLKPGGRARYRAGQRLHESSSQSGEEIRARMVEADVVECMVACRASCSSTPRSPPASGSSPRKHSRPGEVLFIDAQARHHGQPGAVQLDAAAIARIADTFHAWKADGETTQPHEDVPGFCRSVTLAEIAEHGHVLTPAVMWVPRRWKRTMKPSPTKMRKLTEQLGEQMKQGCRTGSVDQAEAGRAGV